MTRPSLLRNQRGYIALLAALSFGAVIVVMVTNYQTYLEMRVRLKARTREAYRLLDAMQTAAILARSWYDSGPQPAALPVAPIPNLAPASCAAICQSKWGLAPSICVDNADGMPFCFYGWEVRYAQAAPHHYYELKIPPGMVEPATPAERFYAWAGGGKLVEPGPLLVSDAQAAPPITTPVPRTDNYPAGLACPGNPGCLSCGGNGTLVPHLTCVTLYACPFKFKGCKSPDYNPATPTVPPLNGALFTQTLFMIPPNATTPYWN